ncbi:nitroreductase [candidate division WOR-3 bacterium]|nr:nitroreductase [candidate division WOR-3 bacterium]
MNVKDSIETRRAYRSLEKVEITEKMITELSGAAQLTMSCFNNQPWRYVFVYDEDKLTEMHQALSKGNQWAHRASMIIAVTSRKDLDCTPAAREYYAFDTGMATAFLILRATELGLIAHPIAGYSPKKTRSILGIPDDMEVLTLVIVGKKDPQINEMLSEKQTESEKNRPERLPLDQIIYHNRFDAEKFKQSEDK